MPRPSGGNASTINICPELSIPNSIVVTTQLSEAGQADVIWFVTPSTALREIADSLAATTSVGPSTILISAVKGIEHGTGSRMSEILAATFPGRPVAVLSGPNLAVEVANFMPTATVIGALKEEVGMRLQRIISSKSFRAYTSSDIVGIEVGGALKNIFAIAAGMADGLGLGDNSKAALVTRSLAEMARLGLALGGKRETFQGLSGAGDLILTCFSRHSRNRRVGERIGAGEQLKANSKFDADGGRRGFDRSEARGIVQSGLPLPLQSSTRLIQSFTKTHLRQWPWSV